MKRPTAVTELAVELIRNQCVNDGTADGGGEHRSVATLASYLGEEGRVFEPHPGRQSVLYRVPGRVHGAPRLMLMPHLDVVPADPENWSVDPFAGEVTDGWVWGRGAVDMLNQASAMAVVFRPYLAGERSPLAGDLLLLATADEESGGALGAAYLSERHWDEVACEYLLTEVAHPGAPGAGLPVTVAEKGPFWRRLVAQGTPGHGSQPYLADNAVRWLAEAVVRLADAPTPSALTTEWRQFVSGNGWDPDLASSRRLNRAIARLAEESAPLGRWAHACTHLTVSPNLFAGGVKTNVIPDRAVLDVDVRALPGTDPALVDAHMRRALGAELAERLTMQPVLEFPGTSSPQEGPLWEAIGRAGQQIAGHGELVPAITPVTTDARFFRARGTFCYGVGLYDDRLDLATFLSMFHGNDERISVESLNRTVDLLESIVEQFGLLTAR